MQVLNFSFYVNKQRRKQWRLNRVLPAKVVLSRLSIIPLALMASESMDHEAEGALLSERLEQAKVSRNGKLFFFFAFLRKQGEIICFSGAIPSGNLFNSDLFVQV